MGDIEGLPSAPEVYQAHQLAGRELAERYLAVALLFEIEQVAGPLVIAGRKTAMRAAAKHARAVLIVHAVRRVAEAVLEKALLQQLADGMSVACAPM